MAKKEVLKNDMADKTKIENLTHYIHAIQQLHCQQLDKIGEQYWMHPVRVMEKLPLGCSYNAYIAALFHDILEDTDYTIDRLEIEYNLSKDIIEMIQTLTKPKQMKYDDYIQNIISYVDFKDPNLGVDLILIKMCDIWDNLDITRMKHIEDKEQISRLLRKYLPAIDKLIIEVKRRLSLPTDHVDNKYYPTIQAFISDVNRLITMYKYHQI